MNRDLATIDDLRGREPPKIDELVMPVDVDKLDNHVLKKLWGRLQGICLSTYTECNDGKWHPLAYYHADGSWVIWDSPNYPKLWRSMKGMLNRIERSGPHVVRGVVLPTLWIHDRRSWPKGKYSEMRYQWPGCPRR